MTLKRVITLCISVALALGAFAQTHVEEGKEYYNKTKNTVDSVLVRDVRAIVDADMGKIKDEVMDMDTQIEDNTARGVVTQEGSDDADKYQAVHELVVVKEPGSEKKPKGEQIFTAVDQQAEFPGGISAVVKWLSNNIRYPESARKNDIQGRVIVKVVIEKDGSIGAATVLRGVDPDLDREAIRLVKSMPKWKPAEDKGVVVRSYCLIPVNFRLQNQ